jgi:N-carbamoyl-L-amino-acid hydrolase
MVDPTIKSRLEHCAATLGMPVLQLGSPASHDAAAFAAAGVPMGMIFVRNANGSHNPREAMTIDDFMAGAALLTQYLGDTFAC